VIDLTGYNFSSLTITDGTVTQTFFVISVTNTGPDYWTVVVTNGLGPNMPINVPVKATFTVFLPQPLPPVAPTGVPAGNIWWNNEVQAFSTVLWFSDQTSVGNYIDLTPF